MQKLKKGLQLYGVFSSEAIDKTGESVDIKGMDISALESGKALANFEHKNDDPSNYLGRISYVRKAYSLEDCKNETEKRMFREAGNVPLLFGAVELFDDEEHPGATALAKMLTHYKKKGLSIPIGFSVEGATLERDGNYLKKTVGRQVSITLKPANASCQAEILASLSKSESDFLQSLSNKEDRSPNVSAEILDETAAISELSELANKVNNLVKALSAGFPLGPVGSLTQGEALAKPHISKTKKAHEVNIPEETTDYTHEESSTVIHKPCLLYTSPSPRDS